MKAKKETTLIRVSRKMYDLIQAESVAQRRPMTTVMDIWLEEYIFPQLLKEKHAKQ